MNVKIGSLNCLNFGLASAKNGKDKLIAKLIASEGFDVIALQEIKNKAVVQRVCYHLNCGIQNGKWLGCADNNDYAFIWNSERIQLPKTTLPNGNTRVFYPHVYQQYGRDPILGKISLVRAPFYGRFQTNFKGLPNIELRLINTHIRYSKGADGKELALSAGEIALRKFEFRALTEHIYYRISDKTYGKSAGEGSPSTAYTILLGDYNLNLRQSQAGSPYLDDLEVIEIKCEKDPEKTKLIVTTQAELTTLRKKNSDEFSQYANNYDHFTFDKNRFAQTQHDIEKIDSVTKYCEGDTHKHIKDLSDHTPIKMTLDIKRG